MQRTSESLEGKKNYWKRLEVCCFLASGVTRDDVN